VTVDLDLLRHQWVTPRQAAQDSGRSLRTIETWMATGEVRSKCATVDGHRRCLVAWSDVFDLELEVKKPRRKRRVRLPGSRLTE
jgi:hypothetical protein